MRGEDNDEDNDEEDDEEEEEDEKSEQWGFQMWSSDTFGNNQFLLRLVWVFVINGRQRFRF